MTARPVTYRDRRLAISNHAIDRLRQRAPSCAHLDTERLRLMVSEAVRYGQREDHYIDGQWRVRGSFLGHELFVIASVDRTGWGRAGWAVVTLLTPQQVAEREVD